MGGELADALIARIDQLIADRLDAAITSRLAAADYVVPDNDGIAAMQAIINARLDAAISGDAARVWGAGARTLTSAPSVIRSIQTGFVVALGSTVGGWEDWLTVSVTIASVNLDKSLVLPFSVHNDTSYPATLITGRLTNPTTLMLSAGYGFTGTYVRARWVVVEFT